MTSFLRTRKDRHPKPENKNRLQHEHEQSHDGQRSEVTQERLHQAYDEQRGEAGNGSRASDTTRKTQSGNSYGKAY